MCVGARLIVSAPHQLEWSKIIINYYYYYLLLHFLLIMLPVIIIEQKAKCHEVPQPALHLHWELNAWRSLEGVSRMLKRMKNVWHGFAPRRL